MRRDLLIVLLAIMTLAGCASPRPSSVESKPPTAHLFPPDALVTQRAVLTVLGRQFTLNGYVAKDEKRGLRLVLTENFGSVMADVLVKRDGSVFVIQAKSPFKPAWVKRFIAADMQCVFSDTMRGNCPLQILSPTHFLIKRRWYKLDLQTVEIKPGAQPATLFDEPRPGQP